MIYYAIADLHGRYDLLELAFKTIKEHIGSKGCSDYKIITLGDYIDRGPDSKEIIESLMDSTDNLICLQGNHEAMMVETIRTPLDPEWWISNGGDATLKSYGSIMMPMRIDHYSTQYLDYDPHVIDQEHVEWISNLPLYYETEKQVFVHAGLPLSNRYGAADLEEQSKYKAGHGGLAMQWMLYGKDDPGGHEDKHVVHGHHQFADGPHEWSGRTNLDTYAWRTGRLVVGVFDDTQGKAIRYLEVLGDDYAKDNPS